MKSGRCFFLVFCNAKIRFENLPFFDDLFCSLQFRWGFDSFFFSYSFARNKNTFTA